MYLVDDFLYNKVLKDNQNPQAWKNTLQKILKIFQTKLFLTKRMKEYINIKLHTKINPH